MKLKLKRLQNNDDEFVKIFGGIDNMRQNFPKTYAAYTKTIENANEEPVIREAEYDYDVTSVCYTDEKKSSIMVEVRALTSDDAGYVALALSSPLVETRSQKGNVSVNFTGDIQTAQLIVPVNALSGDTQDSSTISLPEIIVRIYAIDTGVSLYEDEVNLNGFYLMDTSAKFTIIAPAMKAGHDKNRNNTINIAYKWKWYFDDSVQDYYYTSEEVKDGMLRVPGEGKIVVAGEKLSEKGVSADLMLTSKSGKCVYHDDVNNITVESNNTIKWKFPDSWGSPYNDMLQGSSEGVFDYRLEIKATIQGKGSRLTFIIESKAEKEEGGLTKYTIPQIDIYQDCFCAGTKILMADGSKKEVENLTSGDMVQTPDGKRTIKDVQKLVQYTGLVLVETEKNKSIMVSANHPFMTDKGLVCAKLLPEGEDVCAVEGRDRVVHVCVSPAENRQLYSVALDGGRCLYANDFAVGDSAAELDAAELANNLRYRVPEEWRMDYDSWVKRTEG